MPVTVTDLFCGAGGSSLGAEAVANVEVVMAANHWKTAVEASKWTGWHHWLGWLGDLGYGSQH